MLDFHIHIGIRTSSRMWGTVLMERDEIVLWDSCLPSVVLQCSIVQLSMANFDKMWTFPFPIHFLASDNLCYYIACLQHDTHSLHVERGEAETTHVPALADAATNLPFTQQCHQLKGCINNRGPCTRVLVTVVYTLSVAHDTTYVEC